MDQITIADLEIYCRVGVTEAERAQPQLLRVSVEMDHDAAAAAASDRLTDTIDYFAVAQQLLGFASDHSYRLIETLAAAMAELILKEFHPQQVSVEVKKFVLPQARHVSVRHTRAAAR